MADESSGGEPRELPPPVELPPEPPQELPQPALADKPQEAQRDARQEPARPDQRMGAADKLKDPLRDAFQSMLNQARCDQRTGTGDKLKDPLRDAFQNMLDQARREQNVGAGDPPKASLRDAAQDMLRAARAERNIGLTEKTQEQPRDVARGASRDSAQERPVDERPRPEQRILLERDYRPESNVPQMCLEVYKLGEEYRVFGADIGSAALRPSVRDSLDAMLADFREGKAENAGLVIHIAGMESRSRVSGGTSDLGLRRAYELKAHLVSKGVAPGDIVVTNARTSLAQFGPNASPEQKAIDRGAVIRFEPATGDLPPLLELPDEFNVRPDREGLVRDVTNPRKSDAAEHVIVGVHAVGEVLEQVFEDTALGALGFGVSVLAMYADVIHTILAAAKTTEAGGKLDGVRWGLLAAHRLQSEGKLASMDVETFEKEVFDLAKKGLLNTPGDAANAMRGTDEVGGVGARLWQGRKEAVHSIGRELIHLHRTIEQKYNAVRDGVLAGARPDASPEAQARSRDERQKYAAKGLTFRDAAKEIRKLQESAVSKFVKDSLAAVGHARKRLGNHRHQ